MLEHIKVLSCQSGIAICMIGGLLESTLTVPLSLYTLTCLLESTLTVPLSMNTLTCLLESTLTVPLSMNTLTCFSESGIFALAILSFLFLKF